MNHKQYINETCISFYVETYGCQMNFSDSNEIRNILISNGFSETNEAINSDIIIINTCSVRATAEQRVFGRLGFYKKIKKQKKFILILTGCMAERLATSLLKDFPEVDIVVGTNFKAKIPYIINSFRKNKERVSYYGSCDYAFLEAIEEKKSYFKAYIPIIHGCNNFCSYCIVPYTRGKQISRNSKNIIENVIKLVDKGIIEITLLGQNVNSYGIDNNDITFAELLMRLVQIKDLKRIRFLTSHPKDFNKNLIDIIADNDKICKYVHIPLQSASNKILKDMNRVYTFEDYKKIIDYMRKVIPNLSLSTDILVAYPTETIEDYEMTVETIKKIRYDTAYMFKYSVREGTKASKLVDRIDENEKLRRLQKIITIQNNITKEINQSKINNVEKVLFESVSKNNKEEMLGKTDSNKSVVVKGDKSYIGKLYDVKLINLKGNTFKGTLCKAPLMSNK